MRIHRFITAFLMAPALALAACGAAPTSAGTDPPPTSQPAPTSRACAGLTTEQCFRVAAHSFDLALTAIDLLVDANVIVPGSPTAMAVRERVIDIRAAFKVAVDANSAVTTRQVDDIVTAVDSVTAALKRIKK